MEVRKHKKLKQKGKNLRKIIRRIFECIFVLVCFLFAVNWTMDINTEWKPDYDKLQLGEIVKKAKLSQAEYEFIYMQTGLGKAAVLEILSKTPKTEIENTFNNYQSNFFKWNVTECSQIGFITNEERIRTETGFLKEGFEVPSLKNGDVLITKSTHSMGWRHGHAGIITDAEKGELLEAALWGQKTSTSNISVWKTYPSFILLRLKDNSHDPEKIAEYAKNNMNNMKYGLFTGIPKKNPDLIRKTQCAHLIWYPYAKYGYDIDSDGFWLVTPKDIANSDLFDVVQVYGVNPKKIWQ